MNAQTLLDTLEGLGVQVTATLEGKVRLEPASRVDPALMDVVKARKLELIARLHGENPAKAKEVGGGQPLPSPPTPSEALPAGPAAPSPISGQPRPDWATLSASPGHCGSCARWKMAPVWGTYMGVCGCPASAWAGGVAPLAIHAGHRCAAYRGEGESMGKGYRAATNAQRSSPPPLPPVPLVEGRRVTSGTGGKGLTVDP